MTVTALTLLGYDHLLTLGQEIELVWMKKWSWSKGMFLWNRYATIIIVGFGAIAWLPDRSDDRFCLQYFRFQGWTGFLMNITVQVILLMRILAMYGRTRKIMIATIVPFLMEVTTMATILGFAFSGLKAGSNPAPNIHFCFLPHVPPFLYAYWITNLCYEAFLFSLAVYKAWLVLKLHRDISPTNGHWSGSLYNLLVRDSVIYFVLVGITYFVNVLGWTLLPASLYQLSIAFTISLRSVLASRLLLNIRSAIFSPSELTGAEITGHAETIGMVGVKPRRPVDTFGDVVIREDAEVHLNGVNSGRTK
jgi:hypothetical protein